MPKMIAIWSRPDDVDGFEADYSSTHVRLVEAMPGVSFEHGKVLDGDAYRVAILSFESMEALQAAASSEAGGETMQDAGRLQEQFGNAVKVLVTE